MPRHYERKTNRAEWDSNNLKPALAAMKGGLSERKASIQYGIKRTTLKRYANDNQCSKKKLGGQTTISLAQENELVSYLKTMESVGFGLTTCQVRSLAYEFCVRNKISNNFDINTKLAGKDWLEGFMKRHPSLSLRKPENLSKQRAMNMNVPQVQKFYDLLEHTFEEYHFDDNPMTIYNLDETGFTLTPQHSKIIAQKGKKTISKISVCEKGETSTAIIAFNAAGEYIPPYLIMKGVRKLPGLFQGLPPNAVMELTDSGWSNKEQFLMYLKHYVRYCRRTENGFNCLILDGHSSHADSLDALLFCQDNKIILICLPPHCSHWLQPADRTVFGPMKKAWSNAVGRAIGKGLQVNRYMFGDLFSQAWMTAATIHNAVSGFRCAGIVPLSRTVVPEHAYEPAKVTEKSQPNKTTTVIHHEIITLNDNEKINPIESINNIEEQRAINISENQKFLKTFADILPLPTVQRRVSSRGSVGPCILTKDDNIAQQRTKEMKRIEKQKPANSIEISQKVKHKLFIQSEATAAKKLKATSDNKPGPSGQCGLREKNNLRSIDDVPDNQNNLCSLCAGNFYEDERGTPWIQCTNCKKWMHSLCANMIGKNLFRFECPDCSDD